MVRRIFSTLFNYIKCFFEFILNFPKFIKKHYHAFWQNLHNLKYNLKNLVEANTKLGIYHLNNQNYNDAIFRFKLVDRFFKPQDPLVHYWLGVGYFFKRNYPKALIHLEQGKNEDRLGLISFVRNIDNVSKIPNQIYEMHRGITAGSFAHRFDNKKDYNLPKDLIFQLFNVMEDLPKEYSILDLGSNVGLLGPEIQKRMDDGFSLTGVEISKVMIDLQATCFPEVKYNEMINSSPEEFLLKGNKKKYNIIVSLDGFASNTDLNIIFSKIHDTLVIGGYFVFAVKASPEMRFDEKYLEFSYSKDYIDNVLQQSKLKILTWLEIELAIKNNYFIFVCKK